VGLRQPPAIARFVAVEGWKGAVPLQGGGQLGRVQHARLARVLVPEARVVQLQELGLGDGIQAKIGHVGAPDGELHHPLTAGAHHLEVGAGAKPHLGQGRGKGPALRLPQVQPPVRGPRRARKADAIAAAGQPARLWLEGQGAIAVGPGQVAGGVGHDGQGPLHAGTVHRKGKAQYEGLAQAEDLAGREAGLRQQRLAAKGPRQRCGQGRAARVAHRGVQVHLVRRVAPPAVPRREDKGVALPGDLALHRRRERQAGRHRIAVHGPRERQVQGPVQVDGLRVGPGIGDAYHSPGIKWPRHCLVQGETESILDARLQAPAVRGEGLEGAAGLKHQRRAAVLPRDRALHGRVVGPGQAKAALHGLGQGRPVKGDAHRRP